MAKSTGTESSPKTGYPRREKIYLTALDPALGGPALIIQHDISNRLSEITIVAPTTSKVRFPIITCTPC